MRDKLIELILDYCTAPALRQGDERRFPYMADDLKKYTNEYLLELLEEFLDKKDLVITAVDNTYSEDVGNAASDDILFGGFNQEDISWEETRQKYLVDVDLLYGHMESDPLFPNAWNHGEFPNDWDPDKKVN